MSHEPTVRVLDFDGFENLVEDLVIDTEDAYRLLVGTPAPARDWSDLLDEYAMLAGEHALRSYTRDGPDAPSATELDDESPAEYLDLPEKRVDDGVKRYGDVGFPAWGFDDPTSTDDLDGADPTLAGTIIVDEDHVRTSHPAVLSPTSYLETVRDLRDEHGDDAIVMVGTFAPRDRYSIQVDGGVLRAGSMIYPAEAFHASDHTAGINKAYTSIRGTMIFDRDDLSSDVVELADGDRDEVEPPAEYQDEQGVGA